MADMRHFGNVHNINFKLIIKNYSEKEKVGTNIGSVFAEV